MVPLWYCAGLENLPYNHVHPSSAAEFSFYLVASIEETVISRLQIGHSSIAHSFLFKGKEPPVCSVCYER